MHTGNYRTEQTGTVSRPQRDTSGGRCCLSLIYSADPQSHMTPSVSDTSLDDGHMSREAPGSSLMDTFLGLDTLLEKRGPGRMH